MTNQTSRTMFWIAIGLLALLAAPAAYAQSTMRAQIPFQFHVGDKVLPAGEYRVTYDSIFQRLRMSLPGGDGMFLPAHPTYRPGSDCEGGALVFHKYGNTHFLRLVWTPGSSYGIGLLPSRAEREMAKATTAFEVAQLSVQPK